VIAYLDCFSGISGDMLLGALVDAGLSLDDLRSDLARLPVSGYEVRAERVTKGSIAGTQVTVEVTEQQSHRGLDDILRIIGESGLPAQVTQSAERVFTRLAEAEAAVHNQPVEEIHFHEVGAVDAIVDVVGACAGLHRLGVEEVYASPLPLGGGWVKAAHGMLPVPAPATAELVKGIPTYGGPVEAELVTPTGAAIITTLCRQFGPMPPMIVSQIGWGAGVRNLAHPNLLRLFLGEPEKRVRDQRLSLIQTNLDDMNPELFEHLLDRLLEAGALDVFYTPIVMKKSRPATLVSVLADPGKVDALSAILFRETTALGLRVHEVSRRCLDRRWTEVDTPYGRVRVKLGLLGSETVTLAPEYEDCRRLARERGVPLKAVYEAAQAAARRCAGCRDMGDAQVPVGQARPQTSAAQAPGRLPARSGPRLPDRFGAEGLRRGLCAALPGVEGSAFPRRVRRPRRQIRGPQPGCGRRCGAGRGGGDGAHDRGPGHLFLHACQGRRRMAYPLPERGRVSLVPLSVGAAARVSNRGRNPGRAAGRS